MATAVEARQIDLYSIRRGSLIERMAVLAGRTAWRDPRETWTPGHQQTMPWEHTLAAACVWLREHRTDEDDVTGELLHGLAIMDMGQRAEDRCVVALAAALRDMSATLARLRPGLLDACTRALLRQCVTGEVQAYPPRAERRLVGLMDGFGARIVWAQADQGIRRASEALA